MRVEEPHSGQRCNGCHTRGGCEAPPGCLPAGGNVLCVMPASLVFFSLKGGAGPASQAKVSGANQQGA